MDYSGYVTAIGDLLQYTVVDSASATPFANTDINNILPDMISYAELRMYREFDFISTIVSPTTVCVSGSRNVTIPANLVVLESANIITPVGAMPDDDIAKRNPIQRTTIDFINYTWPDNTVTGLPELYTLSQTTLTAGQLPNIRLVPVPDENYVLECVGTARPAPLSSVNTTTFLTLNMPDLFISASMYFGAGFQGNYGAQSDDPKLASSWESTYQAQKAGLMVEELRKKAQSEQWQPYLPSPLAPR